MPASFFAAGVPILATLPFAWPLTLPFDFFSPTPGLRLGVPLPSLLKYSEDGSLRRGVACFVRAIAKLPCKPKGINNRKANNKKKEEER